MGVFSSPALLTGIRDAIWSPILIGLCLAAGLYFSFKTNFVQVRHLKGLLKIIFKKSDDTSGISSFQAFCVSIAGSIGTGNIVGVATAIAFGGPGALFWMWVIAFLGAASAFAEAVLAQKYKVLDKGDYIGGPAYYIKNGLKSKVLSVIIALCMVFSCGFVIPGVQANAISASVASLGASNLHIIGVALCVVVLLVIIGGIKRIGFITGVIAPFMTFFYMLGAVLLILFNLPRLPGVLGQIFAGALGFDTALAGILGSTIAWGIQRGIHTNEAGQGTAAHSAAAANVAHPVEQGLMNAFGVFLDTIIICTATGLAILITNSYNIFSQGGAVIKQLLPQAGLSAAFSLDYAQAAFCSLFGQFGKIFVALSLILFAFATLLSYFFLLETNLHFLVKRRRVSKILCMIIYLFSVYQGSIQPSRTAWILGDIGVGITAYINLVVILFMSKEVFDLLGDYDQATLPGSPF